MKFSVYCKLTKKFKVKTSLIKRAMLMETRVSSRLALTVRLLTNSIYSPVMFPSNIWNFLPFSASNMAGDLENGCTN